MRLIEPNPTGLVSWFTEVPAPFAAHESEFLVIPMQHIFGSEELSALAAAIAERVPKPCVALNPVDADRLGVKAGDELLLKLKQGECRMTVAFSPELPMGTAGLRQGPTAITGSEWGKLSVP